MGGGLVKANVVLARLMWLYGRPVPFIAEWFGWSHFCTHQVLAPVKPLHGVAR